MSALDVLNSEWIEDRSQTTLQRLTGERQLITLKCVKRLTHGFNLSEITVSKHSVSRVFRKITPFTTCPSKKEREGDVCESNCQLWFAKASSASLNIASFASAHLCQTAAHQLLKIPGHKRANLNASLCCQGKKNIAIEKKERKTDFAANSDSRPNSRSSWMLKFTGQRHIIKVSTGGVTFSVRCKSGIELHILQHSSSGKVKRRKKSRGHGKSKKQALSWVKHCHGITLPCWWNWRLSY